MSFNPNRITQGDVEPTKTWDRNGTKWLGKPDKFLNELPKEVVFPLYEGTETVTLIDDNPHATLWYITYRNGEFAYLELVIRRKTWDSFEDMAENLGVRTVFGFVPITTAHLRVAHFVLSKTLGSTSMRRYDPTR